LPVQSFAPYPATAGPAVQFNTCSGPREGETGRRLDWQSTSDGRRRQVWTLSPTARGARGRAAQKGSRAKREPRKKSEAADCSAASEFDPTRARLARHRSAPALPRFENERRAGKHADHDEEAEGLSLERLHHHDHRMPAPSVRAVHARSATAKVKRARICFTNASLSKLGNVIRIGG
jgi:predicted Fe-S protein YdhL (DUF1289 family)